MGAGRGIEEGAGRRAAGPAAAVRWERSRRAGRRPGGAAAAPALCAGGSRPSGGTACGPMPAPCRELPRKRGRRAEGALQGPGGGQGPGEGALQEPGGPQGNPPEGRVWGRPEAAPYGGEAAGPAGLCPPDLAGCSKRRGFCTGTCTKICGGGSNPLHFGSRYDKINVESCSAAYFFLHTKKPEGGRPPCEALL